MIRPGDSAASRKDRGAFFTPVAIADHLAQWAVGDDPDAKVLDPTCGEAVFLLGAGRRLRAAGAGRQTLGDRLFGVDLHQTSLDWAMTRLDEEGLYYLDDAEDLSRVRPMTNLSVTPADAGKWTDLLLPNRQRQLFKQVNVSHFAPLSDYGSPELGTVTGGNSFFALSQETADRHGLSEAGGHLRKVCPPGTKHLRGLSFSSDQWRALRDDGESVWLLHPDPQDQSAELLSYVERGKRDGVDKAYKCRIREPWWRPPVVSPPDLFFTYMSHRYPRLFTNSAGVTFVNSMHGVRLRADVPAIAKDALPLLALNSVTLLGAEIFGRSYGGGILKMEPREAAALPVPDLRALRKSWGLLSDQKAGLERLLLDGRWTDVVKRVDHALLVQVLGLRPGEVDELHDAARILRGKRMGNVDQT